MHIHRTHACACARVWLSAVCADREGEKRRGIGVMEVKGKRWERSLVIDHALFRLSI